MSNQESVSNESLTACIVAGGDITPGDRVMAVLRGSDIIIAADRGLDACLELGVTPTLCIGDFDSVSDDAIRTARERGWPVVEYPAEKAATDGELALDEAIGRGAKRIRILGALTGQDRLDHGVANLLLPGRPNLSGIDIRLMDEDREAFLLRKGASASLTGQRGDYVTLLPLSETGATVTTWGLKYDLLGISLGYGSTRGVSNELAWQQANITVEEGRVLVLQERVGVTQPS
ncbi:MAG: thiamine diphosphokinase [Dehalococcoidia bacterium]|nr:thiamine diphosphokinase [Dehalococcoidia bacterium]